jgi:hypothetical protein
MTSNLVRPCTVRQHAKGCPPCGPLSGPSKDGCVLAPTAVRALDSNSHPYRTKGSYSGRIKLATLTRTKVGQPCVLAIRGRTVILRCAVQRRSQLKHRRGTPERQRAAAGQGPSKEATASKAGQPKDKEDVPYRYPLFLPSVGTVHESLLLTYTTPWPAFNPPPSWRFHGN